jgi:YcxB-like protein
MLEKIDDVSSPTWRIEANAEITQALVKKSTRRFVWCQYGVGYLVAMGFVLLGFLSELVFGDREWLLGAFGVILGLGLIFPISMWRNLEIANLSLLEKMEKPWVHFVFDEKGIVTDSELGSSSLTWKTVTEVCEFPEFWFLFVGKNHLVLSTAILSKELMQFIRTKTSENRNKAGAA